MSFNPYESEREFSRERNVETLGEYTYKTFLWMVLGLMVTFATALFCWITGLVFYVAHFHLLVLFATVFLSFTMAARIQSMSVSSAKIIFVAYSITFGLTMSIYLMMFGLTNVVFAFLAAALFFSVLGIYGRVTSADLSRTGSILFAGLIFLVIFSVLSIFIPGLSAFDRMVSIVGIAIFLGYTAYDTNKIRDFYYYYSGYPDMMEKASIFSALQLYLDFVNLFLYLLRYFASRRDN